MNLYVTETENRHAVTLDYCHDDGSCDRVVTFICDTEHNEIVAMSSYYDCGWMFAMTIAKFDTKIVGLQFASYPYPCGPFGLYILVNECVETKLDIESVKRLWNDGWIDNLEQYEIVRATEPIVIPHELLEKSIWIGDNDYHVPRN